MDRDQIAFWCKRAILPVIADQGPIRAVDSNGHLHTAVEQAKSVNCQTNLHESPRLECSDSGARRLILGLLP